MDNRWIPSKIGLLDFWYYDSQEYNFDNGRMMLRGSNGSGKSVTMQSFIPLIFDGDIRPERIDPFGSKSRRMDNYLLEEGDDLEERTGYLYMEFKRRSNDQYLTIGIGLRARRNKKLERWYFAVTDGRRVGVDFNLYKNVNNKLALSKIELRNRIGSGGRFVETQSEYLHIVNELLFGYDTDEEYKEMLNLLIQVRAPKLSKDFKPSIINDILGKSLKTLSEDDLRPIAEAIENMDKIKDNIDELKNSLKAANDIRKVYDDYNKKMIYDKANAFVKASDEHKRMIAELEEVNKDMALKNAEIEVHTLRKEELNKEAESLNYELDALSNNDATFLKNEESRINDSIKANDENLDKKNKQIDDKNEYRRGKELGLTSKEEEAKSLRDTIDSYVEDLKEALDGAHFVEGEYILSLLVKDALSAFDYESHEYEVEEFLKKLDELADLVKGSDKAKEVYNLELSEYDKGKIKVDEAYKVYNQSIDDVSAAKEDYIENMYIYRDKLKHITLNDEAMKEMAVLVEEYSYGDDFSNVKAYVNRAKDAEISRLTLERRKQERELEDVLIDLDKVSSEIKEIKAKEDVAPFISDESIANRKLLDEMGVAYTPLYKAIDFENELDDDQRNRLEAALNNMGILNALLVNMSDRERVLSIKGNVSDKYIFNDAKLATKSLIDVMKADSGNDDILLLQQIASVLNSIGYNDSDKESSIRIDSDGRYRIGIVEGNVAENYQASFIGSSARERFRQQRLAELSNEESELDNHRMLIERLIKEVDEQIANAECEADSYISEEALRDAIRLSYTKEHEYELLKIELDIKKEALDKAALSLDEYNNKSKRLSDKYELPHNYDEIISIIDRIKEYKRLIGKLNNSVSAYKDKLVMIESLKDEIARIDMDLDDMFEEKRAIKNSAASLSAELLKIQERLKLVDATSVLDRYEEVRRRLKEIPKETEEEINYISRFLNDVENDIVRIEELTPEIETLGRKVTALEEIFMLELRLNLVWDGRLGEMVSPLELASQVKSTFANDIARLKKSDLSDKLQQVYYQNAPALVKYQVSLSRLFEDVLSNLDGADAFDTDGVILTRIGIRTKYNGVEVGFNELLTCLEGDYDSLNKILGEEDRRLFEDILSDTISRKIRDKIRDSKVWVKQMNTLMESMDTSSGLKLSLRWVPKKSDTEDQLDTKELVDILQVDPELMRQEDMDKLTGHFRSRIYEARRMGEELNNTESFYKLMKDTLDYRQWYEFRLYYSKTGEKKRELTNHIFFAFSGGEKAMSMYVPLFSAVKAKYMGAKDDAPLVIALDEAFAGVDDNNIKDMFRLVIKLDFSFIMNSQSLWGDYETVPSLAIYQLLRPENAKCVSVISYVWNGHIRKML